MCTHEHALCTSDVRLKQGRLCVPSEGFPGGLRPEGPHSRVAGRAWARRCLPREPVALHRCPAVGMPFPRAGDGQDVVSAASSVASAHEGEWGRRRQRMRRNVAARRPRTRARVHSTPWTRRSWTHTGRDAESPLKP